MEKILNKDNNIKKYFDKENKFMELFNKKTGFYMRTGIIDENGKDTGIDPFQRNFPSLIDVGIMGKCANAENGTCRVQCYQGGAGIKRENMSIENFRKIAEQCKDKTFQFALGGRGDVNKHEHFKEILEICKEYDIVANYTTSGLNLTDEEVELTKTFTGAVAVSAYDLSPNGYSTIAINKFINAGIKTNIHYVLGNNSIDMAIDYLKNDKFPKGINAVIFLTHKPVGLGQESNVLKIEDPKVKEFFEIIDNNKFSHKTGFDSCTMPFITNLNKNINPISTEPCESSRYSCYVSSEMIMMPCSFDNQELKWGIDLNKSTIQESWDSDIFEDFRNRFKNSCPNCKDKNNCMGGCPIRRSIVGCNRSEKDLK